jgi:hypothetical protein
MTNHRKPTKAWRANKCAKNDEDSVDLEALQLEILGLWRCPDCHHSQPLSENTCKNCQNKR